MATINRIREYFFREANVQSYGILSAMDHLIPIEAVSTELKYQKLKHSGKLPKKGTAYLPLRGSPELRRKIRKGLTGSEQRLWAIQQQRHKALKKDLSALQKATNDTDRPVGYRELEEWWSHTDREGNVAGVLRERSLVIANIKEAEIAEFACKWEQLQFIFMDLVKTKGRTYRYRGNDQNTNYRRGEKPFKLF